MTTQSERREATPGPWFAHKPGPRMGWRITLTPGDAHGDLANVLAGLGARSADEVAANACLFAAAPNLRAKLSDCVNRLETIRETHPDIQLDDDIASARAALALADTTEEKNDG